MKKAFQSGDSVLMLTCKLFLWHYHNIDTVENTQHCLTINFLYKYKNKKLTKQGIANEIFSNVKSLKTARETYVRYFFHFYDYVKSSNITAESAIALLI